MKKVAIIGGGASGLMAALQASASGADVTLFEKGEKLGRKIFASGNGRCNISNSKISSENYHGNDSDFAMKVISSFDRNETLEFFRKIGLPVIEEERGRLYPQSLFAGSVVEMMTYQLDRTKVKRHTHKRIDKIIRTNQGWRLVSPSHEDFVFDAVVLACGGEAHPALGGSDSGYQLAERLEHRIVGTFPAILPLNILEKPVRQLQGLKRDCRLSVMSGKNMVQTAEGELLFTRFGISGPVTLEISRQVNDLVLSGKPVSILLDFFPEYRKEELESLLLSLWEDKNKNIVLSLSGIMRERFAVIMLPVVGIDVTKTVGSLTDDDRMKIVELFKEWKLTPENPRGFDEAVVTAGGVDVSEVDPQSLESRIKPGIFFAGEILDVDGDCGGYNLQFAWSSGAVAGRSASR